MRCRFTVLGAVLAFVVALTLIRANAQSSVHTGAGASSCGQWSAAAQKTSPIDTIKHGVMASWVQGFVVGAFEIGTMIAVNDGGGKAAERQRLDRRQQAFGTASGWLYDPPDKDALIGWTNNYCQAHPLETVDDAAVALVRDIVGRKP